MSTEIVNQINKLLANNAIDLGGVASKCDDIDDLYFRDIDNADPLGSNAQASDVVDLVLSDMPPLEAAFSSAAEIITFKPMDSTDPKQVREAAEKTAYCQAVYSQASFRAKSDFLQSVIRYPVAALRHEFVQKNSVQIRHHKDVPGQEWEMLKERAIMAYGDKVGWKETTRYLLNNSEITDTEYLQAINSGVPVEVVVDGEFTIKRSQTILELESIDPRFFVIAADATSAADASIIGQKVQYKRSDLIEMGIKKSLVDEIPSGTLLHKKFEPASWGHQLVAGFEGVVMLEDGESGKLKRYSVLVLGNKLIKKTRIDLCDEAVPYSFCSAYLNPARIIGHSRAFLVQDDQQNKTELLRALLDNTAAVGRGKTLIDFDFLNDENDLVDSKNGGFVAVRTLDPATQQRIPIGNIMQPLATPSVAEQVIITGQTIEVAQARRTGAQPATQGIKADSLHKETATRFNGVQDSAAEKITHVLRNVANLVFVPMFNSICYQAAQYNGAAANAFVSGEDTNINPGSWSYDSKCVAVVGDENNRVDNLSNILTISNGLISTGNQALVTPDKIYNQLSALTKAMGVYNAAEFFNNPNVPADQLMAENMQLKQQVEQLQQQVQAFDPINVQEQNRVGIELAKLTEKAHSSMQEMALKLTELEMKAGKQLDDEFTKNAATAGSGMGDGTGEQPGILADNGQSQAGGVPEIQK